MFFYGFFGGGGGGVAGGAAKNVCSMAALGLNPALFTLYSIILLAYNSIINKR